MKKIGLLAAAFLLSACGIGQHTQTIHAVPQDNIVDLHSGQKLTPQQLLAKLRDRPRVIVGKNTTISNIIKSNNGWLSLYHASERRAVF